MTLFIRTATSPSRRLGIFPLTALTALVALAGILGMLSLSGCGSAPRHTPIPKPEPVNKPVDAQAAIDTLIAKPKPLTPLQTPKALTGVVSRKALAHWLIQNTRGGMPKLGRPVASFQDVADPTFSTVVRMSPWAVAFFPEGPLFPKGQKTTRFMPQAPVNREQFCMLAAVLAGQYSRLQLVDAKTLDTYAPPGGKPFGEVLDVLQITPQAKASVAWAYREALLDQAFKLDSEAVVENGLHPGQPVQWEEIQPSLNFLIQKAKTGKTRASDSAEPTFSDAP